jgi:tetratricopeptide (TPR) repeat protein
MKKLILLLSCIIAIQTAGAQTTDPDNATLALTNLKQMQTQLLHAPTATGAAKVKQIDQMLKLGVWDKALQLINAGGPASPYKLLKADYLILHNEYFDAEKLVTSALKSDPINIKALQLKATLQIQAWKLPEAIITCKKILKTNPNSEETELIMGRAMLLQKR